MNQLTRLALPMAILALLYGGACESVFDQPPPTIPEDDGVIDLFIGEGVGDECGDTDEGELTCRDGLSCTNGACQADADKGENEKCLLTAECMPATKECTDEKLAELYAKDLAGDAGAHQERIECLGLHCGWAGFCVMSNSIAGSTATSDSLFGNLLSGKENSPCATASECERELVCKFQGLGGTCKQVFDGAGDLGSPCLVTEEDCAELPPSAQEDCILDDVGKPELLKCLPGLACSSASEECVPGSIFLNPDLFGGEPYCQTYYESLAPFGVRSRVPRQGEPSDFYSLPFPNDTLLVEGAPFIKSHPLPGGGLIGLDPLTYIADALPDETNGWSTQAGIFFRFTRPVDSSTLDGNIRLINLDSGEEHPFTAVFTEERNKYICANYLMIQPRWGTPLDPDTTYGVIITDGVLSTEEGDEDGPRSAVALDDTEVLLGDTETSDPTLTYAWDAYQPLRDHLSGQEAIKRESIVGATVFTTGNPTRRMKLMYDAIQKADGIKLAETPTVCTTGATTLTCADAGILDATDAGVATTRDCPANEHADFKEIHTRVRIPMVQNGKRPYLLDGGELITFTEGQPADFPGYEDVCVSITIPKSPMPEGGWPVMIYGHGTGGTYRTGAQLLGKSMATLQEEGGGAEHIVVIGYDAPMHADRKGKGLFAQLDSGPLYYNFTNPPAAKGNFFQGAADVFALAKFVKDLSDGVKPGKHVAAGVELGDAENALKNLKFNPDRIMFHGHSQSGATGPLITPFTEQLSQVVLSGTGGSLVYGLLGKKQPYDVATGMSIALQEISLNEQHPALHLMQYYFDEVDAAPYGALMGTQNVMHQLHVYGVDDTYTPPDTSAIYAASTGAALIKPVSPGSWYDTMPTYAPMKDNEYPLSTGDYQAEAGGFARATVVAKSDGTYDGHFVVYQDPTAVRWLEQWMATWAATGNPKVVK